MTEKKFKIVTLGCRTNQYESQAYAKQLMGMGYTESAQGADVCIINTCTVTQQAEKSSLAEIAKIARQHPGAAVLVTGCLAEQAPDRILSIPGVSHVVANKEKEGLLTRLFPATELPEFAIENFSAHTRAFVKVQDGCNSFCSYCIIPYVRGRSRSRKVEDVLREVEGLVRHGYKEVVITGINVGDFDGGDGSARLADLVRAVDKVEGICRVRLSSIDPDEVDEDLLSAILEGQHTCHSLHIVLQSGSDAILKRMRRKYTRAMFLDTIDRVSCASPDFAFTTDVIVGFPGETEEDFQATVDVIRHVRFAKVHMFPYSPRPKTRAALFEDLVPQDVIATRKHTLLQEAQLAAAALRASYIGQRMEVLLESCEGSVWTGHTDNFLCVEILHKEGMEANAIVSVDFVANGPTALQGIVV